MISTCIVYPLYSFLYYAYYKSDIETLHSRSFQVKRARDDFNIVIHHDVYTYVRYAHLNTSNNILCIDFFFNTQRSWPGGCGRSYEIYNISIVWIIYNNPCAYIRYLVHLSLRAMVVSAVYNRLIYIYTNIHTCDIYILNCIIMYKVYLPIARDSGTFPRVC